MKLIKFASVLTLSHPVAAVLATDSSIVAAREAKDDGIKLGGPSPWQDGCACPELRREAALQKRFYNLDCWIGLNADDCFYYYSTQCTASRQLIDQAGWSLPADINGLNIVPTHGNYGDCTTLHCSCDWDAAASPCAHCWDVEVQDSTENTTLSDISTSTSAAPSLLTGLLSSLLDSVLIPSTNPGGSSLPVTTADISSSSYSDTPASTTTSSLVSTTESVALNTPVTPSTSITSSVVSTTPTSSAVPTSIQSPSVVVSYFTTNITTTITPTNTVSTSSSHAAAPTLVGGITGAGLAGIAAAIAGML
jgi:hypothetical protein